MSQMTFDFDGKAERKRLNRQSAEILERLRQGPASNVELMQIAQRFGARLHELRACGHVIEIVDRDRATGHVVYQLRETR